MHKLYDVDETEFDNILYSSKIINEENPRRFAVLEFKEYRFGLAWPSDLVAPEIVYNSKSDLVLVGIDRKIVFISNALGNVVFCMGLISPFLFFKERENNILIVSETSITEVCIATLSVNRFFIFPDIITDCKQEGDAIIVYCLDSSFKLIGNETEALPRSA